MARDRALVHQTLAVSAGGAIGSLGRWAVGMLLPTPLGIPWGTVAVNVTGAAAMGLLAAWVVSRSDPHVLLRPFLGTGVLGGWTTFSALSVDLLGLLREGRPGHGIAYVVVTLVGGLVGLVAALGLGRRLWGTGEEVPG